MYASRRLPVYGPQRPPEPRSPITTTCRCSPGAFGLYGHVSRRPDIRIKCLSSDPGSHPVPRPPTMSLSNKRTFRAASGPRASGHRGRTGKPQGLGRIVMNAGC